MATNFLKTKNNAQTTLSVAQNSSTSTSLSIQLADVSLFPSSGNFIAEISKAADATVYETILVTGVASNVWTITRGYDGTTPRNDWTVGDKVKLKYRSEHLDEIRTAVNNLENSTTSLQSQINSISLGAGASSGGPTFVIAASGADTILKNRADYKCTGVNDDVIINNAINRVAATKGSVICTGGDFYLSAPVIIKNDSVGLYGMGADVTRFIAQSNTFDVVQVGDRQTSGKLRNYVRLDGFSVSMPSAVTSNLCIRIDGASKNCSFTNLRTSDGNYGLYIKDADKAKFENIVIDNPRTAPIICLQGLENQFKTATFRNITMTLSDANSVAAIFDAAPEQATPNAFDNIQFVNCSFITNTGVTGTDGIKTNIAVTALDLKNCTFQNNQNHIHTIGTTQTTVEQCSFSSSSTKSASCFKLETNNHQINVIDCRFSNLTTVFNAVSGAPMVSLLGRNTNQGNIDAVFTGTFGSKSGTDTAFAGSGQLQLGTDGYPFDTLISNRHDFVEQSSAPGATANRMKIYANSVDHLPYLVTSTGGNYSFNLTAITPPTGGPGNVTPPPPVVNPGTPPTPTGVFQDGNLVFTSPCATLADFATGSPTTVGGEAMTILAAGQTAPATAPTLATGAAGVLTGTYLYRVTYVTAAGETEGGTISASITPAAQQVALSAIPTGPAGVTQRKVYRTKAGGSIYYLLTTIADNVTTTYTDNTADAAITVPIVTYNTTNAGPDGTACLQLLVSNSANTEVAVHKDLTKTNTRMFRFDFKVDTTASVTGEFTIFGAWTDAYAANLVQIRITQDVSNNARYNFLLRAPGTDNYASQVKKSNVQFTKGVWYSVELEMVDRAFNLSAGVYGSGVKPVIIEWYNGSTNGVYYQFDNTTNFIGGLTIGKFYSTQANGKLYYDNITFKQAYVPPTLGTPTQQITNAWFGFKNRYIRSDGAVVRPNGEGSNAIYQPWSDVVSEGQAYALMFAVQQNDQATFDLVEQWAYNNLERRNVGGIVVGTHLMGWHWDDINNSFYDNNWATDADIDRATALIWAHHRWGSAGTVNYLTRVNNILADLKANSFRTDASNGYNYFTTDFYQTTADPFENNPSYVSVGAFKIIKDFTGDVFWDAAINGAYDLFTKAASATLTYNGKTEVGIGLVPDWCGYSPTSHNVTTIGNRAIKFSYDAFRTNIRIYWHYLWYASTQAQTFLSGNGKTFFKNQWTANGAIFAEYDHDGTTLGAYEKSMMTFGAYLTLYCGDTGNTTANAIYTTKLNNLYVQSKVGDFYKDNSYPGGAPSYFNNSWMLFCSMIKNGTFTNY